MKIIKVHITCPIQLINVNALLNKLYNDFILYIIKLNGKYEILKIK